MKMNEDMKLLKNHVKNIESSNLLLRSKVGSFQGIVNHTKNFPINSY